MRLREPVLIALIVFAVVMVAGWIGDPWATAAAYAVGAGLAVFVYSGTNGDGDGR